MLSAITSALLIAVADFGCRVSCLRKKYGKSYPTQGNNKGWRNLHSLRLAHTLYRRESWSRHVVNRLLWRCEPDATEIYH